MSTFGERLKKARESKGYSQKAFAEALEITPTRLNYWEKDKREPDFYNIRKIIDILECDADQLLGTNKSCDKDDVQNTHEAENEAEVILLQKYRALNAVGRAKVDSDIDDLLQIPKYQQREPSGKPSGFILDRMMRTGNWEELPADNFEKMKEIAETVRKQIAPVKK